MESERKRLDDMKNEIEEDLTIQKGAQLWELKEKALLLNYFQELKRRSRFLQPCILFPKYGKQVFWFLNLGLF